MGFYKWLYPGLRLKRWIALCSLGIMFCSMGFVVTLIQGQETSGSLFVVFGIVCVVVSIRKIIKSVTTLLAPHQEGQLLNILYQRSVLSSGPRIVAIGGGTGLSVLLQGLKERTANLTAIVAVTDDGGSSGRLRNQFNVLPPGDIRNCLVALADSEPLMRDLFRFRFKEGASDLAGHNFGNLFILAMTKTTGDFEKAIRESSRILNIRGRVVPATLSPVTLVGQHADETISEGETKIASYPSAVEKIFLKPERIAATEDALTAIRQADAIVLGPGSLYTSILPNLLIEDLLAEVLRTRVPRIFVCNLMTQSYETNHLSSDFDHVQALANHTSENVMTHCIVNTGKIPQALMKQYTDEGARSLINESQKIRELGYQVVEADLVKNVDYVRHNTRKLAKIISEIAQKK